MPDGEMVALVRREAGNRFAWLGRSRATLHDMDVARDAASDRRSEFHPTARRRAVGVRPQLSGGPKTVVARLTLDGRLRARAHAAVRRRYQLPRDGVARRSALDELLRVARGQDRDLPGACESPLTSTDAFAARHVVVESGFEIEADRLARNGKVLPRRGVRRRQVIPDGNLGARKLSHAGCRSPEAMLTGSRTTGRDWRGPT